MDYRLHYNKLIERARSRILESYTETHHILPRCLGGSDDPLNLVELTPEEHYVAHQLLVKIYPGNSKLIYAANMMTVESKDHEYRGNKLYGWLRREFSEANMGNSYGKNNKGKKFSEQHIKAISIPKPKLRKPKSEEHKRKMSLSRIGRKFKPHTEEHKLRIKNSMIGKIIPCRKVVCPKCNKIGGVQAMHRWHFDNCRVNHEFR